jgi:hypothetical protein
VTIAAAEIALGVLNALADQAALELGHGAQYRGDHL